MLTACVCLAAVAAANGANDVSRAVATLLGGRVADYRRALYWTASCAFVGSLLSAAIGLGVARRFTVVLSAHPDQLAYTIPAVLLGCFLWITLSTWSRLPVATTHALLGSLLGVTFCLGGWDACRHIDLYRGFIIPLVASPFISCAGAVLLTALLRALPPPRIGVMDRIHWFSAGMTAMSRGVNDSAKIWAILLPLSIVSRRESFQILILIIVAAAMLAGSLLFGRRVAERLAFGIVAMSGAQGVAANLVTAATIIGASLLGFPVASSHVASGAIVGVGLTGDRRLLRWSSLATIASAWILTLPASTLLSGVLYEIFRNLSESAICGLSIGTLLGLPLALMLRRAGAAGRSVEQPIITRLIVFVCGSNTSRSPMAESICAALLARIRLDGQVTLLSRGLTATEGEALASSAGTALERLGVSAPPHASSNLDNDVVDRATLIFCMTADQVREVQRRFPFAASKVLRLDLSRDVANPAGLQASAYVSVAAHLSAALDSRLNFILTA